MLTRLVPYKNSNMSDPYVEVVGKVEEANVVVMLISTDLGSDFSKQTLMLVVLFIELGLF